MASGGDEGAAGGRAPDELVAARPVLSHWHASKAKNTSHVFAMVAAQRFWDLADVCLISLDCDQIFTESYVAAVRRSFAGFAGRLQVFPVCLPSLVRSGGGGSLTGRCAYTCFSFLAIGGYDEEPGVLGSGAQDVDICMRLAKQAAGGEAPEDVREGIGDALPNHPSGATSFRLSTEAKVANISQGDFQAAGGSTWADVNKHNWRIMKAKMRTGYVRNGVTGADLPGLLDSMSRRCGCRWSSPFVALRSKQSAPAPTGESGPAGSDAPKKVIPDEAESAKITFYTAGLLYVNTGRLKPVDASLVSEGHNAGRKHWQVRATFMEEACVSSGLGRGHMERWLEFDCRNFRDPERRRGRNHIGMNGFVLLKIAQHPQFEEFFSDVVRRIVVRGTGSGARHRKLHVVFFCKKGRHRSVAMAHLAAVALSELSNWSADTVHLADHAWPFETCNHCVECAHPRGDARKAKQEATRIAIDVAQNAVRDLMTQF